MDLEEFKAALGEDLYEALAKLIDISDTAKKLSMSVKGPFKAKQTKISELNELKTKINAFIEGAKTLSVDTKLNELGNRVKSPNLQGIKNSIGFLLDKVEKDDVAGTMESSELLSANADLLNITLREPVTLCNVNYQSLKGESSAVATDIKRELKKSEFVPQEEILKMIELIKSSDIAAAFKKGLEIEDYCKDAEVIQNNPGEETKSTNPSFAASEVFKAFYSHFEIDRYHKLIEGADEKNIKLAYDIIEKFYESNPYNYQSYKDFYIDVAWTLMKKKSAPSKDLVKILIDANLHYDSFESNYGSVFQEVFTKSDIAKPKWIEDIETEVKKSLDKVEQINSAIPDEKVGEKFYQMNDFEFKVMCKRLEQLSDTAHHLIPKLFELRLIAEAKKKYKTPTSADIYNITNIQSHKTFWKNILEGNKEVMYAGSKVKIRAEDGQFPESYEVRLTSNLVKEVKPGQIILKQNGGKVYAYYLSDQQEILNVELSEEQSSSRADLLSQNLSITKKDLDSMLSELVTPKELKPLKLFMDGMSRAQQSPILVLTNDQEFNPSGKQIKVSYDQVENKLIFMYPVKIEGQDTLYSLSLDIDGGLSSQLKNIILKTPPTIEIEDLGAIAVRYKENEQSLLSDVASRSPRFLPVISTNAEKRMAKARELLQSSGLSAELLTCFVKTDLHANVPEEKEHSATGVSIPRQTMGIRTSNQWHFAAAKVKPYIDLEKLDADFNWMTATNNHAETVFHILLKNKKCNDIDQLLGAFNLLQEKYTRHEGEKLGLGEFLNKGDKDGNTALHILCNNIQIENDDLLSLLKLLEQNGADLSAKNASGQTALHILCSRRGALDAVDYLSDKVDVNAQDKGGFTPLYGAALNHQYDLANHLIAKGANKNLKQTINKDIPETVQEYFNQLAPHGTNTEISAVLQEREKLFKLAADAISNNKIEDLKANLSIDQVMIHERDQNGKSLLHHAVEDNKIDAIKLLVKKGANIHLENGEGKTPLDIVTTKHQVSVLLNASDEVANYRSTMEKDLAKKESSYSEAAVAGAGSLLLGYLSIRKVTGIGNEVWPTVVIADAIVGTAAVSGAAVWGAGRLGYECWHQYIDGADANISEGYILKSNFAKTWKELEMIEGESGVEGVGANYLKDLESKIVEETKKQSPNIVEMGENLIKADILRKSLFKDIDGKEDLIEKSGELIKHFNKWRVVQKGRDMSEGMNVFCDALKTMTAAATTATVSAFLVDNVPIVAAAAAIGGAAKGAVLLCSKWTEKVRNSSKTSGREV